MGRVESYVSLADIERMAGEVEEQRAALVQLVESQIAMRERDLPMLRGVRDALTSCGVTGDAEGST